MKIKFFRESSHGGILLTRFAATLVLLVLVFSALTYGVIHIGWIAIFTSPIVKILGTIIGFFAIVGFFAFIAASIAED